MGTFAGHVLPGSFFLLISVWWTLAIWIRYIRSRRRGEQVGCIVGYRDCSTTFHSQASFAFPCCPALPVEGVFKILSVLCGIAAETITAFRGGSFVNMVNLQHMVMYFFFGMNGAVDLIAGNTVNLPPDTDYASMALALLVEWLLFHFHLDGRSSLDVHVHTLLSVTVMAGLFAVLLEMKLRNNVLCALFRAIAAMLQGTWFIQIGFILYSPLPAAEPWKDHDHDQMMIITALFTAHLAGAIIFVSTVGFLVAWWLSRRTVRLSEEIPFQRLPLNKPKSKTKESTILEESSDACGSGN